MSGKTGRAPDVKKWIQTPCISVELPHGTTIERRNVMEKGNLGCWFEIYVQDLGRAKAFYESVFQITLDNLNSPDVEMLAFPMDMGKWGAGGALVKMEGMSSGGNSTIIYFSCEDCAVEQSRVVAAGGKIQREKWPIGEYGFIALAVDTEGNMIGLHSVK
jgi:predicted enzyme related to lactoylglutathione lyase